MFNNFSEIIICYKDTFIRIKNKLLFILLLEIRVGSDVSGPRLVGDGPHDDAGVVLITSDELSEGLFVLLQQ